MEQIKLIIKQTSELGKLVEIIKDGWPENFKEVDKQVRQYWTFREELAVYDDIIWKGDIVLIPKELRAYILKQIHAGHCSSQSGIRRAKQIVFWINMRADITSYVEHCSTCQRYRHANRKKSLINRTIPSYPFEVVASDLIEESGHQYLLIVDSYSGWFDFVKLSSVNSSEVISHLKRWFCLMGIPKEFQCDGGTQYMSYLFKEFAKEWAFTICFSSPRYPKSNGLAERAVQVAKGLIKRCKHDNSSIELAFLNYRNIPRNDALMSSNQRIMSRVTRTTLPINKNLLVPKVVENVKHHLQMEREQQKKYHDKAARSEQQFRVGDKVMVQNTLLRRWEEGIILRPTEESRFIQDHLW